MFLNLVIALVLIGIIFLYLYFLSTQKKKRVNFFRNTAKKEYALALESIGNKYYGFDSHIGKMLENLALGNLKLEDIGISKEAIDSAARTHNSVLAKNCLKRLREAKNFNNEQLIRDTYNIGTFAERASRSLSELGTSEEEINKFRDKIADQIALAEASKKIKEAAEILSERNLSFFDLGIVIQRNQLASLLAKP